jgi:hypothetical protein
MGRVRRLALLVCLLAAIAVAVVVVRLDARVRAYLAGPPLGGVRIYAAPSRLEVGKPVPGGSLVAQARSVSATAPVTEPGVPLAAGEYRSVKAVVELVERPSPVPLAERPRRVRVTFGARRIVSIDDLDTGAALERLPSSPRCWRW